MPAPSVDQLQALLSAALGEAVRVSGLEPFGVWATARCRIEAADAKAPRSVVVKWLRDNPRDFRFDPRQIATEQAALEFLAEIGFSRSPRLIAADRAAAVLVMEDFSPREPLAEVIRREGSDAATEGLIEFARATAELHVATLGRETAYEAIRARCGPADPAAGRSLGLNGWDAAREMLDGLGWGMTEAAARELALTAETLLKPGPFLAFSNGDPESNNFLVGEGGGRFIDFETAAFRHAATCLTWINMQGAAWITVASPALAARLEDEYRKVFASVVAEASDDRLFGFGFAAACAAQAYERLTRFPKLDPRPAGDRSRLQMVATLESAAAVARRHRALPDLAGWLEVTAAWLRNRWPDADLDLTALPPFTARG